MNEKKLYRDAADQKIAGVCSGLAKYLGIDATVVRLIWVLFCFVAGGGVLAYIICALLIPKDPSVIDVDSNDSGSAE